MIPKRHIKISFPLKILIFALVSLKLGPVHTTSYGAVGRHMPHGFLALQEIVCTGLKIVFFFQESIASLAS